jgi:hypothetical protein
MEGMSLHGWYTDGAFCDFFVEIFVFAPHAKFGLVRLKRYE